MGWQEAGRAILNRRVQLGMRGRGEFAKAAGLTIKTLGELERGSRSNFDPTTLAIVEQVLQWPSGTITQLAAGPQPQPSPPSPSTPRAAPPALDEQFATIRRLHDGLPGEYRRQLRDLLQRSIEWAMYAQQTAALVEEVAEVAGWNTEQGMSDAEYGATTGLKHPKSLSDMRTTATDDDRDADRSVR